MNLKKKIKTLKLYQMIKSKRTIYIISTHLKHIDKERLKMKECVKAYHTNKKMVH